MKDELSKGYSEVELELGGAASRGKALWFLSFSVLSLSRKEM